MSKKNITNIQKFTTHQLLVIENSLVDSYNTYYKKIEKKDFSEYNEKQIVNILTNLKEVVEKVTSLLKPHKEKIMLEYEKLRKEEKDD